MRLVRSATSQCSSFMHRMLYQQKQQFKPILPLASPFLPSPIFRRLQQLLIMSFLLCSKHNKIEKTASKVGGNAFICMNRYCPHSFKVFCGVCKNEHRDHSIKVLSLEDVVFLTDRLLKTPFTEVGRYVGQAVDVLKKLKLIKQFRKKIDLLQKQTQKEALRLIESTESLIHEYALCKGSINDLSELLTAIEQPLPFEEFSNNSRELLCNLDYNFKKDKFEYCNPTIREREDRRRKSFESSKRKIEEVKDYSMKIIEVILHNDDSEEEEEDIAYTKKHYEMLKQELCLEKNEMELDSEISELKNSKSTMANRTSRIRKTQEDVHVQTTASMLSKQQASQQLQSRLQQMRSHYQRTENDLRLKISIIAKEKENTNREIGKYKLKYEEKKRQIAKLQDHLRKNMQLRQEKEGEREELFRRVVELSHWNGLRVEDRFD